jgi:hypothetical protein
MTAVTPTAALAHVVGRYAAILDRMRAEVAAGRRRDVEAVVGLFDRRAAAEPDPVIASHWRTCAGLAGIALAGDDDPPF